jgi:hypothetical protein
VAPFRPLSPVLSVVPWNERSSRLLDAAAAGRSGYVQLAGWLAEAEQLWRDHGRSRMTLLERWDYHGSLGVQFPAVGVRVLYGASGTLPAAAILRDGRAVVEHKLYWASVADEDEARYLTAILNSETARSRVAHMQSRGQWGARDFDSSCSSCQSLASMHPRVLIRHWRKRPSELEIWPQRSRCARGCISLEREPRSGGLSRKTAFGARSKV